jgi:hypothetical protein
VRQSAGLLATLFAEKLSKERDASGDVPVATGELVEGAADVSVVSTV